MTRKLPFAAFLLLFACTMISSAQTLRIQIVNGKSGEALSNQHVVLMGAVDADDQSSLRRMEDFTTDKDGIGAVSKIAPEIKAIYVFVEWHHQCAKNVGVRFSLRDIFATGTVSENSCKPKLSRLTPLPGTLVLYVRDETFFEKMAH
jgi:hypothetical protein